MNWVQRTILKGLKKVIDAETMDLYPREVLRHASPSLKDIIGSMSNVESDGNNDFIKDKFKETKFDFNDLLNIEKDLGNRQSGKKQTSLSHLHAKYCVRLIGLAIDSGVVSPKDIPNQPLNRTALVALAKSKDPSFWPVNLHKDRPDLLSGLRKELVTRREIDVYPDILLLDLNKKETKTRLGAESFLDLLPPEERENIKSERVAHNKKAKRDAETINNFWNTL